LPDFNGQFETPTPFQTPFIPYQLAIQGGRLDEGNKIGALESEGWRRDRWPDDGQPLDGTASNAPGVVIDRGLRHIGELRFLYDPRVAHLREIEKRRTGGRTLRVGRPESFPGEQRFAKGWQRASWRLADAFGVDLPVNKYMSPSDSAAINVNGILRDDGVALRAALRDLKFAGEPEVAGQLPGYVLTREQEDAIILELKNHIRQNGLFLERGEISEVDISHLLGPLLEFDEQNDRTTEEWLAGLIPLISTRSLAYRVSAVGQLYRLRPDGSVQVEAESKMSVIYVFRPNFEDGENLPVTSYDFASIYQLPQGFD